jgi:exodeoxyribonuclease V alpha subunit
MTIVIDEASMLDLPLTFQILKKVPPECRLIFVGDSEQLPPIGPGLVFHLLAKDLQGQVPAAELTKVYRQSDRTGIPAVAKAIREQRWPDLPRYSGKGEGVSIIPAKLHKAEEIIQRVYADLGGNDPDADLHILCVTFKIRMRQEENGSAPPTK